MRKTRYWQERAEKAELELSHCQLQLELERKAFSERHRKTIEHYKTLFTPLWEMFLAGEVNK